ncbi:MAG TPA: hypothetical protein VHC48_06540, partial [Puia sp.]|nr:hypothetical protein [Puia sp.]
MPRFPPAGLETELALSALPPHLRAAATVYLLDPAKGYYIAQHGSNGFVCFIDRTDWEIISRGGGENIQLFDNTDIAVAALTLKSIFVTAIGHSNDEPL